MTSDPQSSLRAPKRRATVAALLLCTSVAGCALLDPTAYGLVYAANIRGAEGRVSDSGEQQGHWRFKGEDDQTLSEGDYVDDVRTGPWSDYYENGNLKYQYTLKDSSRHGLFQSWHPTNKLETRGQFVDGYQFGPWDFFDVRGRLAESGAFLNDHREGRWVKYYPSGQPKLIELHLDGERVGHWQLMDEAGEVTDIWNDMPEGVEWVSEAWPDSESVRREGFLRDGTPAGLWKSFHRDGSLRAVGSFEDGRASGAWHFYSGDGELIAQGQVERGKPKGEWVTASGGSSQVVDGGTTFRGGMPAVGDWSEAAIVRAETTGVVVNTWIEEVSAGVSPESFVSQLAPSPAEAEAAPSEAVALVLDEAAVEPAVPVPSHAFTKKEQKAFESVVSYYSGVEEALEELQSIYRGGGTGSKAKDAAALAFPELGGDRERASQFIGKPLPETVLHSPDGSVFDLRSKLGKKVVLVLLRGYDGEICPYCIAQTKALCKAGALQDFYDRNVVLEVVFPGSKVGLETFQELYGDLPEDSQESYGMRYANSYDVARCLDLEGEKVIPTTFILDEKGIVQFVYVGTTVEDRPTLPLLIEELDRMDQR